MGEDNGIWMGCGTDGTKAGQIGAGMDEIKESDDGETVSKDGYFDG